MSFLRKGILVSAGQMCCSVLNVLTGVLYSRALGPDGMGRVELFRSTATAALAVTALGLGNAGVYFLNNRRVPTTAVTVTIFKAASVLALIMAGTLTLAVVGFRTYFGHVPLFFAAAFSLGVGTQLIGLLLRPVLIAQLAARRLVIVDLVIPACTLTGGVVLLAAGRLEWQNALLVLAVSFLAMFITISWMLREHLDFGLPFDWSLLRGLVSYGLKLAAANILLVLSMNMTVLLLRYLRSDSFGDVGLYTRAVSICSLIMLVPSAIGPLLYAKWAGATGPNRARQVEMATRMNSVYGVLAAIAVLCLGRQLIEVMYGPEFVAAYAALMILAPAVFFLTIFNPCANLLLGDGRAVTLAWILFGTLLVVAIATFALVPLAGIRGAAAGAMCGNVFMASTALGVCKRLYGIDLRLCVVPRREDFVYTWRALRPARDPLPLRQERL